MSSKYPCIYAGKWDQLGKVNQMKVVTRYKTQLNHMNNWLYVLWTKVSL